MARILANRRGKHEQVKDITFRVINGVERLSFREI